MLQNRKPQMGLTKVEVSLGKGSRALNRWHQLSRILATGKRALRKIGNNDDARVIYQWQLTSRWIVVGAMHWTLELSGEEWQALSRALRHAGTEGRSMLAWLSIHKVDTHGKP